MTAPLFLNRKRERKNLSLHLLTNKILNAIDSDDVDSLERLLSEAFHYNKASKNFCCMVYYYSQGIGKRKCHQYIKQVICATYNL